MRSVSVNLSMSVCRDTMQAQCLRCQAQATVVVDTDAESNWSAVFLIVNKIIIKKMYEHPIKRAGLSLNRIIYSNTKMVYQGFPNTSEQKFNLSFKYRTFDAGKVTSVRCKYRRLTVSQGLLVTILTKSCPPDKSD